MFVIFDLHSVLYTFKKYVGVRYELLFVILIVVDIVMQMFCVCKNVCATPGMPYVCVRLRGRKWHDLSIMNGMYE
jgi:hypothetical protein